jgi:hypothetical protein
MCIFFGTNALLFGLFYFFKYLNTTPTKSPEDNSAVVKREKKELSAKLLCRRTVKYY